MSTSNRIMRDVESIFGVDSDVSIENFLEADNCGDSTGGSSETTL